MPKCIFCKKAHLKDKYRCQITGQIMSSECWSGEIERCKHSRISFLDRFFEWLWYRTH